MIEFLAHLSKLKSLNRLEQYVLAKLNDSEMMGNVKIDALFFYHVYADLTALVKSKKLEKSVFDMNVHYLELLTFLKEVTAHPETLLDKSVPVFPSEQKLHTTKSLNHRLNSIHIYYFSLPILTIYYQKFRSLPNTWQVN